MGAVDLARREVSSEGRERKREKFRSYLSSLDLSHIYYSCGSILFDSYDLFKFSSVDFSSHFPPSRRGSDLDSPSIPLPRQIPLSHSPIEDLFNRQSRSRAVSTPSKLNSFPPPDITHSPSFNFPSPFSLQQSGPEGVV